MKRKSLTVGRPEWWALLLLLFSLLLLLFFFFKFYFTGEKTFSFPISAHWIIHQKCSTGISSSVRVLLFQKHSALELQSEQLVAPCGTQPVHALSFPAWAIWMESQPCLEFDFSAGVGPAWACSPIEPPQSPPSSFVGNSRSSNHLPKSSGVLLTLSLVWLVNSFVPQFLWLQNGKGSPCPLALQCHWGGMGSALALSNVHSWDSANWSKIPPKVNLPWRLISLQ